MTSEGLRMTRSEFLHRFEDSRRREMSTVKRPEGGQPLPAITYAIIALIGLVVGLGLLVFYVYEVPRWSRPAPKARSITFC